MDLQGGKVIKRVLGNLLSRQNCLVVVKGFRKVAEAKARGKFGGWPILSESLKMKSLVILGITPTLFYSFTSVFSKDVNTANNEIGQER